MKAHICLSFAAYKVNKELERQLYEKKASIGAEKAIDIGNPIYSIRVKVIGSEKTIKKNVITYDEQKYLVNLIEMFRKG